MKNTKKKYVNEDIDGYKKENQSPLAPAWLFSGKQNEGKVLTGGPDGFVVWGSGGGSGGTTDYNLLDNKPQLNGEELIGNTILTYSSLENKPKLNGVELAGNITFPYVKTASINGNTLTLILVDSNQQETSINFSIDIDVEAIKNAILAEVAINYYDKRAIDNEINLLNLTIDQKTSSEAHYLKNKAQLWEGQNMDIIANDDRQTLTFSYSSSAEPPKPTPDGVYSFDKTKKIYRKYNQSTIFAPTGDIEYCEGDKYNNFPSDYNLTIPRQIFNEPLIFNFKIADESTINNFFKSCLANCQQFNQVLDFSNVDNLTMIGEGFLYGCINFNSPITFKPNKIVLIDENFMFGCVKFNNKISYLFTAALQEIRMNFLQGCRDFNQNLDLSNVSCNGEGGYNKIILINFMANCFSFAQAKIIMGIKTTDIFKQDGYDPLAIQYIEASCASTKVDAPSYQVGFNFEGDNITKNQFDSFVISTTDGQTVNVFQNKNDSPYKKIIVNGDGGNK